jgi:cytochrome bd-type quinol oxidase subunit 2
MKDGNKESIKELLATFRALSGICLSVLILAMGLNARNELPLDHSLFLAVSILLVLSLICTVLLFLFAIPKIHDETDSIIYDLQIRALSFSAFLSFASGILILFWGLY